MDGVLHPVQVGCHLRFKGVFQPCFDFFADNGIHPGPGVFLPVIRHEFCKLRRKVFQGNPHIAVNALYAGGNATLEISPFFLQLCFQFFQIFLFLFLLRFQVRHAAVRFIDGSGNVLLQQACIISFLCGNFLFKQLPALGLQFLQYRLEAFHINDLPLGICAVDGYARHANALRELSFQAVHALVQFLLHHSLGFCHKNVDRHVKGFQFLQEIHGILLHGGVPCCKGKNIGFTFRKVLINGFIMKGNIGTEPGHINDAHGGNGLQEFIMKSKLQYGPFIYPEISFMHFIPGHFPGA